MRCLKLKFSAWRVAFLPTEALSLSLSCLACLRQRRCNSAWAMRSVLRDSVASAIGWSTWCVAAAVARCVVRGAQRGGVSTAQPCAHGLHTLAHGWLKLILVVVRR